MPELDFEAKLKLNRKDNLTTELQVKQEQLQQLFDSERGHEFATEESIAEVNRLTREITQIKEELKTIE
jgi:hypothetical protein